MIIIKKIKKNENNNKNIINENYNNKQNKIYSNENFQTLKEKSPNYSIINKKCDNFTPKEIEINYWKITSDFEIY